MQLDYQILKDRHRVERDAYHLNLSLRVHRALSWLNRAEQSEEDEDARFIFLWIAFNSAYANEYDVSSQESTQKIFDRFFSRICDLDSENLLYELVWTEFASSIRILLNNKYVFKPFWDYCIGYLSEEEWKLKFDKAKKAATIAVAQKNTPMALNIIFSRLYTLRNQIIHGGATWNSGVNRDQIRDGGKLLSTIVPTIIHIMMNNSKEIWGDPCYPVVES